jgi:hypothetical protein
MTINSFRPFILATLFSLSAFEVSAQEYPPLAEWDVSEWTPSSQAACGAFLTKFGLLISINKQTNEVFQILWRGLSMNELSKMTDPATNTRAWAAEVDATSDTAKELFFACGDLFDWAYNSNEIPQIILDRASREANDILLGKQD